ncbi:MAG TPA: hypothetical protein VMB21_04775 [Candidatus Limnocylindria bacterium]|jgi:hypothetical protein|nr:hypothetical protein [Candidatus Limnocylindria bacterium]HTL67239.1 hypothetical protein [Lacunisphaera sp.]
MSCLSVSKTLTLTRDEATAFLTWIERFHLRAQRAMVSDYRSDSGLDATERNIRRAMRRTYGYPGYMLGGCNDTYTLNLGYWVN